LCTASVGVSLQDVSEPEGYNDCGNHNTSINTTEENFNDENDVDDETMSGKQRQQTYLHIAHTNTLKIDIAVKITWKQKVKCYHN
jgi:hypothetical protein